MKEWNILDLIDVLKEYEEGNTEFEEYLEQFDEKVHTLWRFMTIKNEKEVSTNEPKSQEDELQDLTERLREFLVEFLLEKEKTKEKAFSQSKENELSKRFYKEWKFFEQEQNHWSTQRTKASIEQNSALLKKFFLLNSLRNCIDALTIRRANREEIEVELFAEIEHLMGLLPTEKTPLTKVQIAAIQYFISPSLDAYYVFKTIYFDNIEGLSAEKGFLLMSLVNALAIISLPDENARREYLTLFRFGIENDLLIEDGHIPLSVFNNVIFVADSLGDYDLIERAINHLVHCIFDDYDRKVSLLLANAYLCFGREKYAEAVVFLNKLETLNLLTPLIRCKKHVLTIKCIYEEGNKKDKHNILYELNKKGRSFTRMLSRQLIQGDITPIYKQSYQNFINLVFGMARNYKKDGIKKYISTKLNSYNGDIIEMRWLRKKIAELKD